MKSSGIDQSTQQSDKKLGNKSEYSNIQQKSSGIV